MIIFEVRVDKLPKSCGVCKLCHEEFQFCIAMQKDIGGAVYSDFLKSRNPDCPLRIINKPKKPFRMADNLAVARQVYEDYHTLQDVVARRYYAATTARALGVGPNTIRRVINAEGIYKILLLN